MSGEAMADEYESDPEEAKLSLKLRRREASDDEEEVEIAKGEEPGEKSRRSVESDLESDGQGGAADYEDELEEEEQEYYEEDGEYAEEEIEEELEDEEQGGGGGESVEIKGGVEGDIIEESRVKNDADDIRNDNNDNINDGQQVEEEEKKVIEPYAVPTAGAFYMHDDRFRDNAGGRNRRTLGGRKLWESKDDRKWGHDKFEELKIQERHYEERRRTSRGRNRGRIRNRGADIGSVQEHRPKAFNNNNNQNSDSNHSNARKGVRGRGPQRYQPTFRNNNEAPRAQNKQSGKSTEKPSHVSSGRTGISVSKVEPDANPPRKQVFPSNLSITSPPFYPSGSSTKETTLSQRRDVQAGTTSRNVQSSAPGESFPIAQSATMLQGKDMVDSIGMNKLYIDGSLSTVAGKPFNTLQMLPSSSSMNSTQPPPLRGQGRGGNSSAQMTYKPVVSTNQVNRGFPPTQLQTVQRNPVRSQPQSSFYSSGQQFVPRLDGGSQTSPPKAVAIESFEPVELESSSDSGKSKTALVSKGKGSVQVSGRGPFLYSGAQVMGGPGNVGSGNGDQNFPAFLPVMQFGGQHPGGIGVPAVGMAYPGYVAQPQLGLGNSEMTWLPVLAGASGALGTTFGSPYLSLDGSYNAHQSGQASSVPAASSKENNATKVDNDGKPIHRPEIANDDFGQRQKNPRRYTEMKFDQ